MTDLATLGIAIDSTPMARARDELGRFVGAAKAAQQAASGLEGQAAATGEEMASAGAAASAAAGQLTRAGQAAGQAGVGFQGAGAGAEKIIPPLTKLPAVANQSRAQLQQLTYQLNDVTTMALGGASAFQILASQGGQFFQVMQMGEGGVRGTLSRITAGLMALPGPAKVAGAAVAALGVAWAVYESVGRDKVKSLDEVLVDHAALVRDIKKAYGEAATGLDGYTSRGFGEFQARGRASISELQIQSRSLSNDLFGELGSLVTPARTGQTYYRVADRFGEFSDAILKLREEARAGRPDVEAFIKTIADTAQADPFNESLQKSATEAIRLADSLRGVVGQKAALEQFFDSSGNMAAALSGELDKVVKSLDDVARVSETMPEQAERLYRSGLLTAQGPGARAALEAAYLAAQDRIAGANMPLPRAKPNSEAQDPSGYSKALEGAREQLKQAGDALLVYNKGAAAVEAYRMQQTILQAAQKDGIELTADQIKGVEALADAYTALLQEREKLRADDDLNFERDQIGRSPTEQRIATTLRGIYGAGYGDHMNEGLANKMRQTAAMKELHDATEAARKSAIEFERDTAGGFLKDLYSGLREGKNGFEALADAATNALDKIANKLMDAAIDDLLNTLFPSADGKPRRSAFADLVGNVLGGGGSSGRSAPAANDNVTAAVTRSMGIGSDVVAGGKISGLNDNFRSNLNQMISDAASAGFDIDINSGYRSVERQQQLWNAALKKYGSPDAARRWVAPPGRSMHNFGMAADLGYNTPGAADWAHDNAGKYGLKFPLSNENWHIEPMNARAEAAGRSLQEMATSAKSAAQATSGLGSGLSDLTNSVSSAASKIAQGGGGGISLGGINYAALTAPSAGGVYANGAAFFGGNVIPFANGGAFSNSIVARPTLFPMASGAGLMGEAGPEAVMPLRKATNGRLGVEVVQAVKPAMPASAQPMTVSAAPIHFVFEDHSTGAKTTSMQETTRADGSREVRAIMNDATADAINKKGGPTDRALTARGAVPRTRRLG